MGVSGIVAEFNPLHNGHKYLMDCAKNDGNTVICVISGNFVQRGDTAIVPKFTRAEMAINCGADVVIELPTPWAMSTAQNFAFGAVSQLAALGVDSLYFGSESANIDELLKVADILKGKEFEKLISSKVNENSTFAALRNQAVCELLGYETNILNNPNDTLAIEYINASKTLGLNLKFVPIKRVGVGHNDIFDSEIYSNATLIREAIHNGDKNYINRYMPDTCVHLLRDSPISDISRLDTSIIARLKLLSRKDFSSLPDISEGIENLLYNKVRTVTDYKDLIDELKSKRYTMARIRRLVLSAFLGIDNKYFGKEPPYVRVLGFVSDAAGMLSVSSSKAVVTKVTQIKELDSFSQELFELENRINEIYSLSLNSPDKFKNEYKEKLIVKRRTF